jgi:PAS domain-containing protein
MNAAVPFPLLLENLTEGVATLSDAHDILFCNRRFAELLSLPALSRKICAAAISAI